MSEDISANVDATPLGEDALTFVTEELQDVVAECYKIATRLGIKPSEQRLIKKKTTEPEEAMEMIIEYWLDRKYNVATFGEPSWKKLVEVVAHKLGAYNNRLAGEIAKRHPAARQPDSAPAPPKAKPTQPAAPFELPPPKVGDKDPNFFEEASSNRTETDGWGSKKKFHQYPPLSKEQVASIKLSFGSVSTQSGEKRSIAGAYGMTQWPHGVAIIINNEKFQRQSDREGTGIDEKNLVQTLRYLGYMVEVHNDCDAKTISDIMEGTRKRDHGSYDSFICCILSHGKMGQIFGSDSVVVSLDEITNKLSGDNCKSLANKPKMFFMQACRGTMKDRGVAADGDEMEEETKILSSTGVRVATDSDTKIPSANDFYFSFATASGHVAWRDLDNGSWYVSELCRSLTSYARFASLNDIMTITNKRVGSVYDNEGYKQSTEIVARIQNDIFFF